MVINRKRVLGLSVHMIFEHVFYSYRIQISPSFTVLQNIIRFNKREEVTEFPLAVMVLRDKSKAPWCTGTVVQ